MNTITHRICIIAPKSRLLMLMLLLCLGAQSAWARLLAMGEGNDSIDIDLIIATGLPVLEIKAVDGEWPTADTIRAPGSAIGKSITNVTVVPGQLTIYDANGVRYDSGEYIDGISGMTFHIRGNSTAFAEKKPYKIELEQKADLLLRNNPSYRDKDWIIISDETLRTMQGLELNRLLEMPWTPGYAYVNVVINDDYHGIYMLLESVKRNTSCRINVSNSGFIFEHDAYWWNEEFYIPSSLNQDRHYTFKYPSSTLNAADTEFMTQRIGEYEASLSDGTYPDHIDVTTLAKWCLGQDILGTSDAGGVNRFFALYDRKADTRIVVPLMWDFGSSENNVDRWSRPHLLLMRDLFNSTNRTFLDAYITAWRNIEPTLAQKMMSFFNALASSEFGNAYRASLIYNNLRWGDAYGSDGINERGFWFYQRTEWLNKAIYALNPRGDVDINGKVEIDDLNAMFNMIAHITPINIRVADLNEDGKVDIDDINALIDILTKKSAL